MTPLEQLKMNNKEILETLKKVVRKPSIKLPSQLDIEIIQNDLTITIPFEDTLKNMQTDSAAFESWAIIVKRWIENINRVIIKWDEHILDNEKLHYQRFLFRAKRFSEVFSWVNIHKTNEDCFRKLKTDNGRKIIVNTSKEKRSSGGGEKIEKELNEYKENELEELILSDIKTCEQFKRKFDLNFVDNQLPVGVFEGEISEATRIFPGRKSAIDIWGINNENEICLFELKTAKNKKVGALSEMLFYSFVVQDIVQGVMKFDSTTYEGLQKIQEAKNVNCYLLAPSTHPLIDRKVFSLLNKSTSKIEFGNVKINDDLTFSIL